MSAVKAAQHNDGNRAQQKQPDPDVEGRYGAVGQTNEKEVQDDQGDQGIETP